MKKKFLITLLLLIAFAFVLSLGASAEKHIINYDGKKTGETDENGVITLRDTTVNNLDKSQYTIKDADGNDITITQQFLGWYTLDGRVFEPGETVTFTEDTRLYQASGAVVYNYTDMNLLIGKDWWYIRLGADLTIDKKVSTNSTGHGSMAILDLNGHSITTSAKQAFGADRSGIIMVGKGSITHTGSGSFYYSNYHVYQPEDIGIRVGKDVKITTSATLCSINDVSATRGIPKIYIWGDVTADSICKITKSTKAEITVHKGANVVVTGSEVIVFSNKTSANVYAIITLEGNITLKDENALLIDDFMATNSTHFEFVPITSGSFTVSIENAKRITDYIGDAYTLKATENQDGTTTYSVIQANCEHNWVLNSEESYEPVLGQYGLDVFDCTECLKKKKVVTLFVPSDFEIEVTVREEDGEKKYTLLAKDVFKFSTIDTDIGMVTTITDVIYRKNEIVKLEIPNGIYSFKLFSMDALEEISLSDGLNMTLSKETVKDCPNLKAVILGKSTVIFAGGSGEKAEAGIFMNCPSLVTLDVSNANATFNTYSFASNATIQNLILGEGNSYVFHEDSFRHSRLTKVVIPDNTPTTLYKKCFAETETIEYVYIGAGSISNKSLGDDSKQTSIFGGNSNLSKVVLMDIKYISKWTFSTKKPGNLYEPLCDIFIYTHSTELSYNAEAFNDRTGNYTMYLYTLNGSVAAPSNCNYVIFKGIGHAYTEGVICESTCVTFGKAEYVTDCPCGIDYRSCEFTSVSNILNDYKDKSHEPFGTEIYDLPLATEHTLSDVTKSIKFENGFYYLGTRTFKCLYCNEASGVEEEASFPALFSFNGYSVPENGALAISVGYTVFQDALSEYESIMGALEFGVVGAIYEKLGGLAPLAQSVAPVVKAQISAEYASFDFIISGFTAEQMDLGLVMCAYVYDGTKYVYLQEVQTDNPTSVSISGILMQNA